MYAENVGRYKPGAAPDGPRSGVSSHPADVADGDGTKLFMPVLLAAHEAQRSREEREEAARAKVRAEARKRRPYGPGGEYVSRNEISIGKTEQQVRRRTGASRQRSTERPLPTGHMNSGPTQATSPCIS